eukprot:470356-Rhodomonas_salina.1
MEELWGSVEWSVLGPVNGAAAAAVGGGSTVNASVALRRGPLAALKVLPAPALLLLLLLLLHLLCHIRCAPAL